MDEQVRQLAIVYKNCFATESGVKVLEDLKKKNQFMSIVPLDMPAEQIKQLEGSRNVVVYIMNMIAKELS